jgi:probable rRNA maturation factor
MPKALLVEILNEQDELEVDLEQVRLVCKKILDDSQIRTGNINIVFVNSETIHQYNVDFLHHDYPTDVISFMIEDRRHKHHLEGEVLVCTEIAKERAKEFGWSPLEETLLYVIHGTLHLVGFDDKTADLQEAMQEKERKYLQFIGINPPHWNWDDWEE